MTSIEQTARERTAERVKRKRRVGFLGLAWWQWAAHLLAWVPLALLAYAAATGGLTVNPIQDATQRMGRAAILLLTCALAVTPVQILTGLRQVQKLARPLGLYAFMYALIHLFLYTGVDYGFDLTLLIPDVIDKKFVYIGFSAFLILLALAATSFRWWMKRLGKRWKMLHRLVYAAGVLVVIHYAMAVKGDALRLRGNILLPILYGLVMALLLVLRIPQVRKWVVAVRRGEKMKRRPSSPNPFPHERGEGEPEKEI